MIDPGTNSSQCSLHTAPSGQAKHKVASPIFRALSTRGSWR